MVDNPLFNFLPKRGLDNKTLMEGVELRESNKLASKIKVLLAANEA